MRRCHNLLSGHIIAYCEKLISSRTNQIAMPLRRCVIRRRLDKSDRIGIETCFVFQYTAISHHRIFSVQLFRFCAQKKWRKSLGAILQ